MDIDPSLLSGPPLQQGIAAYSYNPHRGHKLVSRWPSVTPALKTNPPCRSLTRLYLQAQCNQLLIAWRTRIEFQSPHLPVLSNYQPPHQIPQRCRPRLMGVYTSPVRSQSTLPAHQALLPPADSSYTFEGDLL
jgi:hypothetical protein